MRKIAMLIPLALGACDAPARRDQPTLPAEPPAGAPVAPLADSVVPTDFQGRWALVPADCEPGRADAKGLMVIEGARLRFYESRGLIAPARSGMTRIYSARDRARLALILKGKQLGFTLVEIRAMLANEEKKAGSPDKSAAVGGLHLSREQIVEQLDLLRSQRAEIEDAIKELEGALTRLGAG